MKWLKRLGWGVLALVLFGVVSFFTWVPPVFDGLSNKVDRDGALPPLSATAQALHNSLTILDLHSDTLLWDRSLDQSYTRGHVDLSRLQRGNVAVQVFSSVTKSPAGLNLESNAATARDNITLLSVAQLDPPATWGSLLARSLNHADEMKATVARLKGDLRLVLTAKDLDAALAARAKDKQITAALLSTEGAHNLEGKLENVDVLFDAGFRMFGLVHFFDNEVAGSMHGERKGGLTPLGRQVVARMEAKGMMVDLAHASHATIADVLAMATKPIVYSHGGVRAACPTNRNLTDEEVRGIAKTGGIIGMGYWEAAVCDITPKGIAKAIRIAVGLAGIDHVSLGSDWDGAVWTFIDASQVGQITQALRDEGFSADDIGKIMGGNAIRVFRQTLPPG
jgi:membrane dipeptidase